MHRICLVAALLCGCIAGMATADEWKLVWSDEFDQPGQPDPTKWDFEHGFIRNEEAQFYTDDRSQNATVADGVLQITARQEQFQTGDPRHPVVNCTSASLNTLGNASWTYGRFEVRARLPKGRGTWPAIWMMGTNQSEVGWPTCGEIDIMEHVGFEPNRIHAHIHTKRFNHVKQTDRGDHIDLVDTVGQFHIYRVDWYRDRLEFFVDDKPYFEFKREAGLPGAWPFDKPHYLLINLAIGGSWGGRNGIDDSIFPAEYAIDYVRVYQQTTAESETVR